MLPAAACNGSRPTHAGQPLVGCVRCGILASGTLSPVPSPLPSPLGHAQGKPTTRLAAAQRPGGQSRVPGRGQGQGQGPGPIGPSLWTFLGPRLVSFLPCLLWPAITARTRHGVPCVQNLLLPLPPRIARTNERDAAWALVPTLDDLARPFHHPALQSHAIALSEALIPGSLKRPGTASLPILRNSASAAWG